MILLDTNALLWVYEGSDRLGESAVRLLRRGRAHYSSVSVMEIVVKHMLGRIGLPGDAGFPSIFAESGLVELPFTGAHAAAMLADAQLARHDPFDRMLVAQARTERLRLLTSEKVLLKMGEPWIVDATR